MGDDTGGESYRADLKHAYGNEHQMGSRCTDLPTRMRKGIRHGALDGKD